MSPRLILNNGHDIFKCCWSISHRSTNNRQHPFWHSVDVTIRVQQRDVLRNGENDRNGQSAPIPKPHTTPSSERIATAAPVESLGLEGPKKQFILDLLSAASSAPSGRARAAKLIIPRVRGYIVRSDIIPLRMIDALDMIDATSFAGPQQWFPGETLVESDLFQLSNVFHAAAGGAILDVDANDAETNLDAFEMEIRNRLSFPWILERRRPKQTLVFVGNYLRFAGHGGTGRNHYEFAKALDINLVVLDAPECWLKDPRHSDLRAAFLPCDLTRDDGLCDRIINALAQYKGKIDGIVTFHESLQTGVAKAAELLSLPTLSPTGLEIAADKFKTAVAVGRPAYLATSVESSMQILKEKQLQFPLILKPCRGWGSEGVYKAINELEFTEATKAIVEHAVEHGPRFVIEEYCDGPEVDVNMVLCNGELLFAETCDETLKRAEGLRAGNIPNFIECDVFYPSRLPSSELNMLVRDLHQTLLRLGLHTGVYHVEARVKNSAMVYTHKDGLLELEYNENQQKEASTWLIEINARPPGSGPTDAVHASYGVDYVGLGMLSALQDYERMGALSHPFIHGPQYWCEALYIPVDKGGIFDSDNICDELVKRKPELAQYISSGQCLWRRGERVLPPSHAAWFAYFIVFSRVGRTHLMKVSETIRNEVRYSVI